MNREIDEMANDLAKICPDLVENCCGQVSCVTHLTLSLSKLGYRKASDVAREIFAEFQGVLFSLIYLGGDGKYHIRKINADKVTEIFEDYWKLIKKYESEDQG